MHWSYLLVVFLFASVVAPATILAQESSPGPQRLVYFDVWVDESLTMVYSQRQVLTQVMASELAPLPGLTIMDRESPENMALQRKLDFENCDKAECRFVLVNAMPAVDLMLQASLEPFGDECVFSIQIKDVRTGTIANSGFEATPCAPRELLLSVKKVTSNIWPPQKNAAKKSLTTKPLVTSRPPVLQGRYNTHARLVEPTATPIERSAETKTESTSPGLARNIARWGGVATMAVGGAVLAAGWNEGKQGRAAYDEAGQSPAHYDNAMADVKAGNRYQSVGGFVMAAGAIGFGLSFVLE